MTENPLPLKDSQQQAHASPLALGLVVFLCVFLIGTTGILKYQLDQAATNLLTGSAVSASGTPIALATQAMGYGGFLGAAQNYVQTPSKAGLDEMKQDLKQAQDQLGKLDEKAPQVRQNLQGALSAASLIMQKAQPSADAAPQPLSGTDLLPAYVALTTLSSSTAAGSSAPSKDPFHIAGYGLLFISWISLILTAGMSVALHLARKSHQSAPLRALAQSVQNLSRGDMQTPIWGVERRDAIGELARSLDLARYHFSQLPDLSLLSDQGPVRLKFEGETRSLFKAMLQNIGTEYERARAETKRFTDALAAQQNVLAALTARLNKIIDDTQKAGSNNEELLRRAAETVSSSVGSLAQMQEKASSQIGKLVPFMQERAQNMAEVTHIAGTQVAQTLQNILQTSQDLRASSAQNQQAMKELASATNGMSERLFAAVNLMQASGKALTEATESAKSRFNESIETFSRGEQSLMQVIGRTEDRLNTALGAEEKMASLATRTEESAGKMEQAVDAMASRQESLGEQAEQAAKRMETILSSFDTAQRSMSEAVAAVRKDGASIEALLENLRTNNEKLIVGTQANAKTNNETIQRLAEQSQILLQRLEIQITQQSEATEEKIGAVASQSGAIAEQALHAASALAQTVATVREEERKFSAARQSLSEGLGQIRNDFEDKASRALERTETMASQSYERLTELSGHMDSLLQRLNILGQLTGTLGSVAGQLGQIVPTLTQSFGEMQSAETPTAIPEKVLEEIQSQWHTAMMQIEAMHDQLAQIVIQQKDQLETRLMVLDKKIKTAPEETGNAVQQAAILNEIVTTLSKINDHVVQLEETSRLSEDPDAREA